MLNRLISYKKYFSELLDLAFPMIIGNISHILIGSIGVFVAAKYSLETISAVSIANSIMMCIFMIGIGFLSSISPVVSNFRGARKPTKKFLISNINYSLILALIFGSITLLSIPIIDYFGFEQKLVPLIKEYIFICSFSYFGAYLHFALKEFLQAYEIILFPNLISIAAVFLNLVLNFAFVFGFWIIPEMGIKGMAIATLIDRTLMGLILFVYCFRMIKFNAAMSKLYIGHLIKVGFPISVALLLEFLAFNSITLIMGRISGIYAAAQNIVLTIATITFMVPLAVSNAIAVKVGFANGARNYTELKRFSISGVALTEGFMFLCALILFFFPGRIIGIFTDNTKLMSVCIPLISIAALFQIFDGFQVSLSGILKGLKMTKLVSAAILFSYWIIGLPLGFLLAFKFNMMLKGFWIGIAIALFFVGFTLLMVIMKKFAAIRKNFESSP